MIGRALLALLVPAALAAQGPPGPARPLDPNGTWITMGLGAATPGFAGQVAITHHWGIHGVTARGMLSSNIHLFTDEVEKFADAGLMYGIHVRAHGAFLTLRAGPGVFWYESDHLIANDYYRSGARLGMPFEAGMSGVLGGNFGIGLSAIGNLNSVKSIFGLMLTLSMGELE
jgi:hypothetical protein